MAERQEEAFEADGKTRVFTLKQPFRLVMSVKLNDVPQIKNVAGSPALSFAHCEVDHATRSITFPADLPKGAKLDVTSIID